MNKILLSVLVASTLAIANDTNDDKLVTHTELGYIKTDGNTDTTAFNLESKLNKSWGLHTFSLLLDGQTGQDNGEDTKNKFYIELNYDYAFTDRLSFNYIIGYKDDKFSGYDYQAFTGPGIKYKAIVSKNHNLTVDSNILYSEDKLEAVLSTPAFKNSYTALRAGFAYEWQINENLKFTQEANYRSELGDMDNYFVFSKTAFSTKISDIFSAGISYKIDYTNIPAIGKDDKDKTLTANLIMDY